MTTRSVGSGRITVVGTVPDQALAAEPGRAGWCPSRRPAGSCPTSVTVATSTDAGRPRLHVLHNWGWDPQTVSAPAQLRDLLTDEEVAPGATLQLGAWDVRVFHATTSRTESDLDDRH